MTEDSVERGSPARRQVSGDEWRTLVEQIQRLLGALLDPRGTTLDPRVVVEQLEALRQRRVRVLPSREPSVVFEEWGDWTNLGQVPLSALGLRRTTFRRLSAAGIATVADLVQHSEKGLRQGAGVLLGPILAQDLRDRMAARGLAFASSNESITVGYVIGRSHGELFPWWTTEEQDAFCQALGVTTLGELSRVTLKQVVEAPWGQYRTSEPNSIVQDMQPVEQWLPFLVQRLDNRLVAYGLPPIARS